MEPAITEVETEGDLFNNWLATQELLEDWQDYALNLLEPLANWTWSEEYQIE